MLTKRPISTKSGIPEFAPHLSESNKHYPSDLFRSLYDLENKNFWFKNRNKILFNIVKDITSKNHKLFEVGCGTGFVLEEFSKMQHLNLTGGDIYTSALSFAKSRVPKADFVQIDITDLPYEDEFNIVCAFDVLEHIEDDKRAISNIYKSLRAGGYFLVTVPQHKFLWSKTDELALHKRRYSKDELVSKLKENDFDIKFTSSYVFAAFPFMIMQRFISKNNYNNHYQGVLEELRINPKLDYFLNLITQLDVFLLNRKISIPFGGSLVVLAQK